MYIAIDLKSFYASVECVERGIDPLDANLVVADETRTEKTICLAVSPGLKSYGIPGRARLFEVIQRVKEVNAMRRLQADRHTFTGESCFASELKADKNLELGFIIAPPRMKYYMHYSSLIYNIYLKYVSPEDIHVYSIDEVFIDISAYSSIYKMSARELCMTMIQDVLKETGITATAGIAPNLYLCKVAMDIVAKHIPADKDGVRIAEIDEMSYRELLWDHRPLTDFWRVGRGISRKLEAHGLMTMGDVARCSVGGPDDYYNEELLYKLFGVNAELLIDHAWGWEPTTIADIRSYVPETHSISIGQVLKCPYTYEKARLIVREMTELLSLDLVDKGMISSQLVLTVCYDSTCLDDPAIRKAYKGAVTNDFYGKPCPKPAHGTENLDFKTSSTKLIMEGMNRLFDRIIDPMLTVRRVYVVAENIVPETEFLIETGSDFVQLDLFTDYESERRCREALEQELQEEKSLQKAVLSLKSKYGSNVILKGMNLVEGGTTIERNGQVGGHKA